MAGLSCKLCENLIIDTEVRVVFKSRIVHINTSALKAMNWAMDNYKVPCTLKYVYVCSKCGFEELKHEKWYNDRPSY
jgi:hypothetical protein